MEPWEKKEKTNEEKEFQDPWSYQENISEETEEENKEGMEEEKKEGMEEEKKEGMEEEMVSGPSAGVTEKAIQKPPALESSENGDEPIDLESLFNLYATFGDREGVNGISLKNVDRWMRQAGVLDPKYGITKEDTAKQFAEISGDEKRINLDDFQRFVISLAKSKNQDIETMMNKLLGAGGPKVQNVCDLMTKYCKGCS
ncbi:uncharacterized protein NPIL_157791 [Nephila pilipes]|uniref:Uncharacterized protein n=1 Tax=Nephila pilipes TaxID=299642 RepID=A0A8X6ULA2_NEPPI|nr:uncharacterized protein NPIL_157791 [Nephila pilipes]